MSQDFSRKQQNESKNMEQAPPANGAGMEDAVYIRGEARTEIAGLPGVFRGVERHVNQHGRADNIFARNAAPEARIERILTVVAHGEITFRRYLVRKNLFFVGKCAFVGAGRRRIRWSARVRLFKAFAVDPDGALTDVDYIAGKADDALDVVRLIGIERRLEDDDLLAFRIAPQRNVNVCERDSGVV